jgi:hypothetical protein
LTDLTSQQLVETILRALKEAARDVDERRVPLDGRVRLPSRETEPALAK